MGSPKSASSITRNAARHSVEMKPFAFNFQWGDYHPKKSRNMGKRKSNDHLNKEWFTFTKLATLLSTQVKQPDTYAALILSLQKPLR